MLLLDYILDRLNDVYHALATNQNPQESQVPHISLPNNPPPYVPFKSFYYDRDEQTVDEHDNNHIDNINNNEDDEDDYTKTPSFYAG